MKKFGFYIAICGVIINAILTILSWVAGAGCVNAWAAAFFWSTSTLIHEIKNLEKND